MLRFVFGLGLLAAVAGCQIDRAPLAVPTPGSEVTSLATSLAAQRWQGDWGSDDKGFVRGAMTCWIPDPVPTDADGFTVRAVIESPFLLLTAGSPRIERVFACRAHGVDDGPQIRVARIRVTMEARSAFGLPGQTVMYEATLRPGDLSVHGRYRSENPADTGWFRLDRVAEAQPPLDSGGQ